MIDDVLDVLDVVVVVVVVDDMEGGSGRWRGGALQNQPVEQVKTPYQAWLTRREEARRG